MFGDPYLRGLMPTTVAEAPATGKWHDFGVPTIVIAAAIRSKAITSPLATHDLNDIVHHTRSYRRLIFLKERPPMLLIEQDTLNR